MTVHGKYGVMLQISENVIQDAVDAYYIANRDKFKIQSDQYIPWPKYGISIDCNVTTRLKKPTITLKPFRRFEFELPVEACAVANATIKDVYGNHTPPPPPLNVRLSGLLKIEIEGKFCRHNNRSYLAVNLNDLKVTEFVLSINNASVDIGKRALKVLSTIVRRYAILTLTTNVREIPVSMTIGEELSSVGINSIVLDYKNVDESKKRALALLLRINHEVIDYEAVTYAIDSVGDVAIFTDLALLNLGLDATEIILEGKRLSELDEEHPNNDLYKNLELSDVHFLATNGCFVVQNIEVAIRIVKRVVRTIKKIICTAIDPCNWWCEEVFETIVEDILQLDQIGNVSGTLFPYIEDNALKAHPNLDADIANWAKPLILAAGGLIPIISCLTPILVILSPILLSEAIDDAVKKEKKYKMLNQYFPSANLRIQAKMVRIVWHNDTMGIIGKSNIIPG